MFLFSSVLLLLAKLSLFRMRRRKYKRSMNKRKNITTKKRKRTRKTWSQPSKNGHLLDVLLGPS